MNCTYMSDIDIIKIITRIIINNISIKLWECELLINYTLSLLLTKSQKNK